MYESRKGFETRKFTTFGRRFSLSKKRWVRERDFKEFFFLQKYLGMKITWGIVLIAFAERFRCWTSWIVQSSSEYLPGPPTTARVVFVLFAWRRRCRRHWFAAYSSQHDWTVDWLLRWSRRKWRQKALRWNRTFPQHGNRLADCELLLRV